MRYRKVKRILSGLLTMAMLTGQVPSVLAADNDAQPEAETGAVAVSEEDDVIIEETDLDGLVADEDYMEGRLVALVDDEAQAEELAEYYGGSVDSFSYGMAVIVLDDLTVAQAMAMEPFGGCTVEPDYIYKTVEAASEDIIGDEVYDDEGGTVPTEHGWGDWYEGAPYGDAYLNTMDENYQWMHDMIHSYAAWGVTTGNSSVKVAVVGSGVDENHSDFADYDGNNRRAVCNVVGDYERIDATGEGTHSAGIIAAGLKNGHEAVGVAPGVSVLGIRVCDNSFVITSERLASAINTLADASSDKVDIILLDTLVTGRVGSVFSEAEQKAINKAVKAGITVIAGAGDEGSNSKSYPASYENVISVGAVNLDGTVAGFSNKGSEVDIYAPGVEMASTGNGNRYYKRSSTSAAASVVAGVAALYISAYGKTAPEVLKEKLLNCKNSKEIVDAARIFKGDTKAPEVVLNDGFGNITDTQTGKTKEISIIIPGDGYITINPKNYEGKEGNNGNAVVVYSFDGTAPKIKNGEVTHGEVYNGKILLKDLYKESTSKTKYTLIAAAVTGIGVMSKTTTVTFTVDPKAVSKPMSLKISGVSDDPESPTQIPMGYYIPLRYEAVGIDTRTITWSVDAYGCSASISKNGVLYTAGKEDDGVVTVTCKATSPKEIECKGEFMVIAGAAPVAEITLNVTKKSMECSDVDPDFFIAKIDKLKDANKTNVRAGMYSIDWYSSDESVAAVEELEEDDVNESEAWKCARIVAKGAGKCTITCAPLDGSGKTATIEVTVTTKANSFKINGPQQVIPGKSYTLKATDFDPVESTTNKVNWLFEGSKPAGVSLNAVSGKLTIGKKAEVGESFSVIATAGGARSEVLDIEIVKGAADKLIVETDSTDAWYQVKLKKNGCIKSLNLFTKDPAGLSGTGMIRVSATGFYKDEDLGLGTIFKSGNENVVTVKETVDGCGAVLKAVGRGTATISCTYADSGRKKISFKVTVSDPVESIKVSGQSAIAYKKSATFKAAEVLPETAGNKKVSWSISDNVANVKISKNGKVTLGDSLSVNKVTVVATAMDGSGVKGTMDFVVCTEKTKSITLDTNADEEIYDIKRAKKTEKLQSARLYSENIPRNGAAENKLTLFTDSKYALDWTSSKPGVAKVEAGPDGTTAVVTAVGKGNTTISCKAQDGSGKKASIKISVKIPASGLNLVVQDGQSGDIHFLAYEKSVSINAVIGKSFGEPSDTKVSWDYQFCTVEVERDEYGNPESFDVSEVEYDSDSIAEILGFTKRDGLLTMPSVKKVKNSSLFDKEDDKKEFFFAIRVTATTDAGLGYESSKTFIAVPKVDNLCLYYNTLSIPSNIVTTNKDKSTAFDVKGTYTEGIGGNATCLVAGFTVQTEKPSIASAYYDENRRKIVITGRGTGSTYVTCTLRDGSGKKLKIKVTVN